jgi:hypothetical protein
MMILNLNELTVSHLGSVLKKGNKMWTDIHSKMMAANSTYLVHINFSGLNCYPEILKQTV